MLLHRVVGCLFCFAKCQSFTSQKRQAENASKATEIRIQRKKEVGEEKLRVIEEKKRREEEVALIHNATVIE